MTDNLIAIINQILADGDRVELIPVKDGIRVFQIRRNEIKKARV